MFQELKLANPRNLLLRESREVGSQVDSPAPERPR